MNTASLRTTLEERRSRILTRIDSIERDLKETRSKDFAEQVTERENEEVLQGLLAEAGREQIAIRTALQRIDSGDYGICKSCGEPIAEKRLIARPEANTCIDCAE